MSIKKASQKNREFYKGKKVFVTGHTGFKGAWLTAMLHEIGADSCGYALAAESGSLFEKIDGSSLIKSIIGDIRDFGKLKEVLCNFKPDIVIHFAAQAIVNDSFNNPKYTYETNVMGTVNLLEVVRSCESIKSCLVVTTDKVYENKGGGALYRETDRLGGIDPYSSSKTCMEFITDTYKQSYLLTDKRHIGVSTARASNVIGGGDYVQTRLIPSILNSFIQNKDIELRNPDQTRPWQSVLDALNGYLSITRLAYQVPERYSSQWNIGPLKEGIRTVLEVVRKMQHYYYKRDVDYVKTKTFSVVESKTLGLDITKSLKQLDWRPELSLDQMLYELVDFFKQQQAGKSEQSIVMRQVRDFVKEDTIGE
ncbi:MAG: CDP-glucose 4,6-dehydratase [Rickettsiales bacterium]|jgi:CDP-glucose 4,6-dehydratase|nr:CDP-glucose 4,6-dehydratase [Rickettsiales bacterium]